MEEKEAYPIFGTAIKFSINQYSSNEKGKGCILIQRY